LSNRQGNLIQRFRERTLIYSEVFEDDFRDFSLVIKASITLDISCKKDTATEIAHIDLRPTHINWSCQSAASFGNP
jgi:hypothetical protein